MTTWTVVDRNDDHEHFVVSISPEGLRRAANDNALLVAAARTHEIIAGTACGLIVVAIVWAIFRSL
jgi:type IV secretory pathway TrbD component